MIEIISLTSRKKVEEVRLPSLCPQTLQRLSIGDIVRSGELGTRQMSAHMSSMRSQHVQEAAKGESVILILFVIFLFAISSAKAE